MFGAAAESAHHAAAVEVDEDDRVRSEGQAGSVRRHVSVVDAVAEAREIADLRSVRGIVQGDPAGASDDDQRAAVGGEKRFRDHRIRTGDREGDLTRRGIEDEDLAVLRGGGDPPAVRAEVRRAHRLRVLSELVELLPLHEIVDEHLPACAAGGEPPCG